MEGIWMSYLRTLLALSAYLLLSVFSSVPANAAPVRPQITGISNISVYTSDPAATNRFYTFNLGLAKGPDPENPAGQRYYVNATQFVEVLPLPAGKTPTSLDHVGYITTNARGLRAYLIAHSQTPEALQHGKDGSSWFFVKDPEGNSIEFVQNPAKSPTLASFDPIGRRMIHVGYLVHDRAKEDTFYRAVLGFRPYWYGGRNPPTIDWVSQQVPDGTDWLEYMVTSNGNVSVHQLGVLDHFSIGVRDMSAAAQTLQKDNRISADHSGPQIGRDGKWQYNLFDPSGIRVELMEFKNVQTPCCSPFTASNPSPE
jgi:catechol 2,3-dioxygenase-like lactoylglutathione lyase family enzyme